MTLDEIKGLQNDLRAVFNSPSGKNAMRYIERIGGWTPSMYDSSETNEIIARDANRRLIGTLKTLMELTPQQVYALENQEV